jgi:hypothetical protein
MLRAYERRVLHPENGGRTLHRNDDCYFNYTMRNIPNIAHCVRALDSSWNVMAHGDAREGKWRGKWRMEWVTITLHTTSEHCVSSFTTADAHTSAACSQLKWRPRRFNGLVRFAERRNLVSARVPSHLNWPLPHPPLYTCLACNGTAFSFYLYWIKRNLFMKRTMDASLLGHWTTITYGLRNKYLLHRPHNIEWEDIYEMAK